MKEIAKSMGHITQLHREGARKYMNNLTQVKMDKVRNLKFGMNALIDLEGRLGKPISEIGEGFSMADLRTFFFIGLKWEDKELTLEQTGELLDEAIQNNEGGFNYLAKVMTKAIEKSMRTGTTHMPN